MPSIVMALLGNLFEFAQIGCRLSSGIRIYSSSTSVEVWSDKVLPGRKPIGQPYFDYRLCLFCSFFSSIPSQSRESGAHLQLKRSRILDKLFSQTQDESQNGSEFAIGLFRSYKLRRERTISSFASNVIVGTESLRQHLPPTDLELVFTAGVWFVRCRSLRSEDPTPV
ncbi:predicted protein [Scheffersomyces stipitis CBS 6054]|uniref:Uncharacterized protein n=1 Tax=Scheffersomyces stipitis (strain ATCC 58785 / CBS 6054 / NBRC 10063 / NRRL Y-11545) TaxID=322104 RepID=A3LXV0_PICST|nr:predicted protein [Scheffersomyces stipitis CBS 6054]ABN67865.2 predicted protein [Scheffersomyces stipitis CBS 6054]